MKTSPTDTFRPHATAARPIIPGCFAALLAGLLSVSWPVAVSHAQPSDDDEQGGQVLTRGPVHEAFAGVISFNPEPGIVVRTAPPELIEELPPEERPEGDDVTWIPGYWAWDDERNDYIWISGTWRTLPPGREWMAGYWRDTGQGYQWISGYWSNSEMQETTYLPPPPVTLEIGANIASPSPDYGWTPGCWEWQRDRYAWRAGYWAQGRVDWVWVPSYYVWTPRGVIFVEGFWDYPVQRRGILFAPVYYQSRSYSRRGYSYSPRIVISLSFFNDNLFLRPSYCHYYFGDYYDSRYDGGGFYASYSYQSSRRGYDPFYSYNRWEHRSDRDWDNRYQASYRYRRENEIARPPRTWSAQLTINTRSAPAGGVRIVAALPIAQLATRQDNPVRFQAVAQVDRQQLARRGREVQQSRDSRRSVEANAVVTTGRNEGRAVEPVKVSAPRSPIVARPATQRGRNSTPPERPQTPRADPNAPPRSDSRDRPQNGDRRNPAENRQPERNAPADQRATEKAREESQRDAQEAQRKQQQEERKAQQDAEKRTRDEQARSQAEERSLQATEERARANNEKSQRDAEQRALRAQQQADDRAKAAEVKAREEAQRKEQQAQRQADERGKADRDESQRKARQDDEKRANDREDAQQRANEAAARAKQQAEERAKAAAEKDREESPRRAPQTEKRAPQDEERRTKAAPAKTEPPAKGKPAPKEKTPEELEEDAKKEKERERPKNRS